MDVPRDQVPLERRRELTLVAVARAAVFAAIWRVPLAEPPEPQAWRLIDTPSVHLGVRPALDISRGDELPAIGLTVQLTVRTPW